MEKLGFKDIEKRMSEIAVELETDIDKEKIEALSEEVDKLQLRKKELEENVEKRNALLGKVVATPGKVIEEREEDMAKEVIYDYKSVEYRNAFLKKLMGKELTEVEERAYVHTTANTSAVLPAEMQNKIYSNMAEVHPILGDVDTLRSGTVIKIVKHTAILDGDATKPGEGVANADEKNTFVPVTLAGEKFSKHVDISYELDAMSIPAFEAYLVAEIGDRLGSAMASDIVAQITSDLAVGNKYDSESDDELVLADILKGFSKLKAVGRTIVYVSNETLYQHVAPMEGDEGRSAFIPNFQDAIAGALIGKQVKVEDAVPVGQVLVLDPRQFLWNEVRGIFFERDRDIKKGVITIAGHAIAEGSLTNDKAGALLTITTAGGSV